MRIVVEIDGESGTAVAGASARSYEQTRGGAEQAEPAAADAGGGPAPDADPNGIGASGDGGAPPAWLLDAVTAAEAASNGSTLGSVASEGGVLNSDAGPGPAI